MKKREIKFRVWNKEKSCWYEPTYEAYKGRLFDLHLSLTGDLNERMFDEHGTERIYHESIFPDRYEVVKYVGLKDKNGKELFEGDLLRIKLKMGENPEYNSDGIFKINLLNFSGLSLSFVKAWDSNPLNQFPINQNPSFENHQLGVDFVNNKFDQLAMLDTWGENTLSRISWREHWYSNDIEHIGSIYSNPELLNQ